MDEQAAFDELIHLAKTAREMELAGVEVPPRFIINKLSTIADQYHSELRSRSRQRGKLLNVLALVTLFALGNLGARYGMDTDLVMAIFGNTAQAKSVQQPINFIRG